MHFAKVSVFVMAILSFGMANKEKENGSPVDHVGTRRRAPYVSRGNGMPSVSYERGSGNTISSDFIGAPTLRKFVVGSSSRNDRDDVPLTYLFDFKTTEEDENRHYNKEEVDASGAERETYRFTDIEGLYQPVDHDADYSGFHDLINEPEEDDEESPADVHIITREPSSVIQKNYNAIRDTRIGGTRPFGARLSSREGVFRRRVDSMLRLGITGGSLRLAAVLHKLYRSGNDTVEPEKDEED